MKAKKVIEIEVDEMVAKNIDTLQKINAKLTRDLVAMTSKVKILEAKLDQYSKLRIATQDFYEVLDSMDWIEGDRGL